MKAAARAAALSLLCAASVACGRRADTSDTTDTSDTFLTDDQPGLAAPQHCDASAPPPGVRTVQVVFTCDELPVGSWRALPDTAADTLAFALNALLAGPTPAELEAGLTSFFSAATAGMLNRAEVRAGVAYLDFADFSRMIPNASTSAGSAQLLDQIAGTVFQFDGIHEAVLTFDGSCDAFWNWLQRSCQRLSRDAS
jgi:hypothetical protein